MKELMKHVELLKVLYKTSPKMRLAILENAPPDFIKCLAEASFNIMKGNIPITPHQKNQLKKKKRTLHTLYNTCCKGKKIVHVKKVKRLLQQTGGGLPFLIAPLLSIIAKAALGGTVAAATGMITKKLAGQ